MTQTDGAISNGTKEPEQSQKGSVGSPEEPETKTGDKPRGSRSSSSSSSTAELGGMLLAFLFGGVGFAVRVLWIPALVVMAVVFGLILAERRSSKTTKGVVPEIVAHVVSEARDIYQAASGSSGEEDSGIEAEESVHDGHHPVSDDERVPAAWRKSTVSDGPTQLKALKPYLVRRTKCQRSLALSGWSSVTLHVRRGSGSQPIGDDRRGRRFSE